MGIEGKWKGRRYVEAGNNLTSFSLLRSRPWRLHKKNLAPAELFSRRVKCLLHPPNIPRGTLFFAAAYGTGFLNHEDLHAGGDGASLQVEPPEK